MLFWKRLSDNYHSTTDPTSAQSSILTTDQNLQIINRDATIVLPNNQKWRIEAVSIQRNKIMTAIINDLAENHILVSGIAGAGKSVLLYQLARTLRKNPKNEVLVINAKELTSPGKIMELMTQLELHDLELQTKNQDLILLIENAEQLTYFNKELWQSRLSVTIDSLANTKTILFTRPDQINNLDKLPGLKKHSIPDLSLEEVKELLNKIYSAEATTVDMLFPSNTAPLYTLLRNPLHLHMALELLPLAEFSALSGYTAHELFDLFNKDQVEKADKAGHAEPSSDYHHDLHAGQRSKLLSVVAWNMFVAGSYTCTSEVVGRHYELSTYKQLLDRGVLQEYTEDGQQKIKVWHDKFLEWLIAKDLARMLQSPEEQENAIAIINDILENHYDGFRLAVIEQLYAMGNGQVKDRVNSLLLAESRQGLHKQLYLKINILLYDPDPGSCLDDIFETSITPQEIADCLIQLFKERIIDLNDRYYLLAHQLYTSAKITENTRLFLSLHYDHKYFFDLFCSISAISVGDGLNENTAGLLITTYGDYFCLSLLIHKINNTAPDIHQLISASQQETLLPIEIKIKNLFVALKTHKYNEVLKEYIFEHSGFSHFLRTDQNKLLSIFLDVCPDYPYLMNDIWGSKEFNYFSCFAGWVSDTTLAKVNRNIAHQSDIAEYSTEHIFRILFNSLVENNWNVFTAVAPKLKTEINFNIQQKREWVLLLAYSKYMGSDQLVIEQLFKGLEYHLLSNTEAPLDLTEEETRFKPLLTNIFQNFSVENKANIKSNFRELITMNSFSKDLVKMYQLYLIIKCIDAVMAKELFLNYFKKHNYSSQFLLNSNLGISLYVPHWFSEIHYFDGVALLLIENKTSSSDAFDCLLSNLPASEKALNRIMSMISTFDYHRKFDFINGLFPVVIRKNNPEYHRKLEPYIKLAIQWFLPTQKNIEEDYSKTIPLHESLSERLAMCEQFFPHIYTYQDLLQQKYQAGFKPFVSRPLFDDPIGFDIVFTYLSRQEKVDIIQLQEKGEYFNHFYYSASDFSKLLLKFTKNQYAQLHKETISEGIQIKQGFDRFFELEESDYTQLNSFVRKIKDNQSLYWNIFLAEIFQYKYSNSRKKTHNLIIIPFELFEMTEGELLKYCNDFEYSWNNVKVISGTLIGNTQLTPKISSAINKCLTYIESGYTGLLDYYSNELLPYLHWARANGYPINETNILFSESPAHRKLTHQLTSLSTVLSEQTDIIDGINASPIKSKAQNILLINMMYAEILADWDQEDDLFLHCMKNNIITKLLDLGALHREFLKNFTQDQFELYVEDISLRRIFGLLLRVAHGEYTTPDALGTYIDTLQQEVD